MTAVVHRRSHVRSFLISDRLTAPIVGSLAGNVLSHFRVELDYPDQKLYLSP